MTTDKIALFQTERLWPVIRDKVMYLVDQEHSHGRAQNGLLVHELEISLAKRFERKFCVTFANCSDALTAAVASLQLPPASCIAVSDYTFVASCHAISRAGHRPMAVDINDDYCMDLDRVNSASAAMTVDIFGNMTKWKTLGIPVIVDAAQSLESHDGLAWSAQRGLIACLSFSPSKTVSSWGSGGALLTDDADIAQWARLYRLHGKGPDHACPASIGINSMLSSFEAACITVGLEFMDQWHQRRDQISRYIIGNSRFESPLNVDQHRHTFHKLVLQSSRVAETRKKLLAQNIQTAVHYETTVSQEASNTGKDLCTNSQRLRSISFTVPNQHTLTDLEVESIYKAVQ